MCADDQLVLPVGGRNNIGAICEKLSWEEAKRQHKWLGNQKTGHVACILCGSTDPCEVDELISEEENVWIVQPM
jgi:hypothetical protein